MTSDPSVLIEVLVATGFLTAVSESIRWFFGRSRSKVDSAQVVQGMAIDLLAPLHEELRRANVQIADLRAQIEEALNDRGEIAAWALAAKALLDANEVRYPVPPATLRRVA